jgi:hypothetical protein
MKQSDDNRIVTATFICEDDAEAEHVINEISALATERGCNLLFSGVDKPEDHHEQAAEELGIYDHSRS